MVLKVDVPAHLVAGDVESGYGPVADAFRRNFAERGEIGAVTPTSAAGAPDRTRRSAGSDRAASAGSRAGRCRRGAGSGALLPLGPRFRLLADRRRHQG